MTDRPYVWVTGIGVIGSCGIGASAFWQGLHSPALPAVCRPVAGFDPATCGLPKAQLRRLDRFSLFAVSAAFEALRDAGLATESGVRLSAADRTAVSVGTGMGGVSTFQSQAAIAVNGGADEVSPFTVPMMMPNAAAAAISMLARAGGLCETVTTACAAGAHAIAAGMRWIQWGLADVVIAGASDALLVDAITGSFQGLGALSSSGYSRPFDTQRDGFCISEGAGILVLESQQHARKRGAEPYARLAGAGSTADAYHLTAPAPDQAGAKRCIRLALQDAGISAAEVSHINAHGTSTPLNDASEAAAIRGVFGGHRPAVTSIKGATGHPIGAAGAVEAVAVALSYRHRSLPPTAGTETVEPSLGIDVVRQARPWDPSAVVSNSFAFGGHNAALVFTPA